MSKRKRIKKLVKGYLNRVDADGNIADAVDTLEKRKAVLKTMDAETNAVLLNRLGFTDAGKPGLEAFDIDGDSATFKNDFAPFDAREKADADSDGIGDNREIVTLYQQLLTIKDDAALAGAQATAAGVLIVTTGTQLSELQAHESVATGGDGNTGDYDTALVAFNAAVSSLETIRANAQAKLAEADTAKAAMLALPQPAAGITYDTFVARDKYDAENGGTGIHNDIATLAGAIDTAAEFANERVADADRTAAGNTTRG